MLPLFLADFPALLSASSPEPMSFDDCLLEMGAVGLRRILEAIDCAAASCHAHDVRSTLCLGGAHGGQVS